MHVKRLAKSVIVILAILAIGSHFSSVTHSADPRGTRSADMQRRMEETKRKVEQHRKEVEAKLGKRSTATHTRPPMPKPPTPKPIDPREFEDLKRRTAAMRPTERPKALPFSAARAESPEASLAAYVSSAKSATSMEHLLRYLPTGEANSLKEYQATHDPTLAASRREEYRREGRLDSDAIAHLTNPPYTNALKRHRDIAAKTLAVLRVELNGDKAKIEVSTSNAATINGARYPYSTGTYDLVGEGTTWKIAGYNDGNVYYQDPPARRPAKQSSTKSKQPDGK